MTRKIPILYGNTFKQKYGSNDNNTTRAPKLLPNVKIKEPLLNFNKITKNAYKVLNLSKQQQNEISNTDSSPDTTTNSNVVAFKSLMSQLNQKTTAASTKASKNVFSWHKRIELYEKFKKKAKFCILCIRLCKRALDYNVKIRDKYLSFSQMYDFENELCKEAKRDFLMNSESAIRSEMLNFNRDYYRPSLNLNKLKVARDIKTILDKLPVERSLQDVKHLMDVFKHLKSVHLISKEMQEHFFKVCWLESYEPKRVIIRQDQRAEYFYIIVSGSLVVTERPHDSNMSYTVCFLEPGMSFGELALLSRSQRTSTVISRHYVELLVIKKDDFYEIFMGEKPDEHRLKTANNIAPTISISNMEFLMSIKFLKGWPVNILLDCPQALLFCYFRRKQVLVRNSNFSKYIYIVKKGSLSIWIKIRRKLRKDEIPNRLKMNILRPAWLDNDEILIQEGDKSMPAITATHTTEEDQRLSIFDNTNYFDSDKFLEEQHEEAISHMPSFDSSLNHVKPSLTTFKAQFNLNSFLNYIDSTKAKGLDNNIANERNESKPKVKGCKMLPGLLDKRDRLRILDSSLLDKTRKSVNFEDFENKRLISSTRLSTYSDGNLSCGISLSKLKLSNKSFSRGMFHLPNLLRVKAQKGASVVKLNQEQSRSKQSVNNSIKFTTPIENQANGEIRSKFYKTTIELIESNDANFRNQSIFGPSSFRSQKSQTEEALDEIEEFLEIQTLTPGCYFGLSEILFESQPDLYLISNGCDCILLSKDTYMQHANTSYLANLRKDEIPFPTVDEIMKNYDNYIKWEKDKSEFLRTSVLNKENAKKITKYNKTKAHLKFIQEHMKPTDRLLYKTIRL